MEIFNFKTPEFLMCELPIKDNSKNDDRIWIYHTQTLSLIEFICVSDFQDFNFNLKVGMDRFEFQYDDIIEDWFGVFVQNNCDQFSNDENKVLKSAWQFLKEYLEWECGNL